MYNPIQLTDPFEKTIKVLDSLSVDPFRESTTPEQMDLKLYTEAVFSGGKEKLKPIVDDVTEIKNYLEACIEEQNNSIKAQNDWAKKKAIDRGPKPKTANFDPKAFWRNNLFKKLEDDIATVFGFRNVEVHPYIEKYVSKSNDFQSKELNCAIYHMNRFPVEGLVTDSGFYDKSKSITMELHISLGLIHALTPEEIIAVFLHEFGHGVDPALVDIRYTETNILSKYLTDRQGSINKNERKLMNRCYGILGVIGILTFGICKLINLFQDPRKLEEKKLAQIKQIVKNDRDTFGRQKYTEAYADNFARMYGFGPQLASAFKKMSKTFDNRVNSRYKKEKERQEAIVRITIDCIRDSHKTDIHRIRALLKEYDEDINDPNTPKAVRKQLQDDKAEMEKILDEYLNNFGEFQNRVNKIINNELIKKEAKDARAVSANEKIDKKEKEKALTEGVEFFDEKTNHEKFMERRKKHAEAMTTEDRKKIREKFGSSHQCSWGRDDDGVYCYTHRCRSKSYDDVSKMPQKAYDFVCSTS
ncbi:MAG: hypothetical protein NC548_28375 [Lachnospiraceae bacterium]|nr:hypothetical protein [Lachnospiraceae bacterium]MCM1232006.1 hypothetical protein [Ruminococcus flavefaciens]